MPKLFRTWEFPRSGSKAKNGEKRKEEDGTIMITRAKLCMAHASRLGQNTLAGKNASFVKRLLRKTQYS